MRAGCVGSNNIHDLGVEWLRGYPVCNGVGVHQGQSDGFLWIHAVNCGGWESIDVVKLLLEKTDRIHPGSVLWVN